MLTKIKLENFQAHDNLELDLGRFTTITGGSNSGKSAILRAVAGLLRNDSAANYIQHGKDTLKVTFVFEDFSVEWIKGKKENSYRIIQNGNIREFTKVGSSVPEEVIDLLRLSPIELRGGDKLNLNVHSQLESPFLIASGPTFVAKVFGELTSASQIYSAIGEGSKQVRSLNSEKTSKRKDLTQHQESLDDYSDLPDMITVMSNVSSIINDLRDSELVVAKIKNLNENLKTLDEQVKVAQDSLTRLPSNEDLEITNQLEDISSKVQRLSNLKNSLDLLDVEIPKKTQIIKYLDRCLDVDIDSIESLQNKISELTLINNTYKEVVYVISGLEKDINSKVEEEEMLENSISSAIQLLTTCPTCERALDSTAKEVVLGARVVS